MKIGNPTMMCGLRVSVLTLVFSTAAFSSAAFTTLNAEDWPQFRGNNCSGVSTSTDLPVEFSTDKNVLWSHKVGDGVGGVTIADGRVFVSGMTAEDTVSLFAYDAASGKELWKRDWPAGDLMEIHASNSQASSTPAADGDRVYFYFTTLGLVALDAKTGSDCWTQKLPVPFFVFKWGPGMSPILYKDLVIFCQDDDIAPAMYAFDKQSGEIRWKDDRSDMCVNYSHPVICTTDGRDDLVVAGTGSLIGYDPETGTRRWFARILLRNIKTTPVAIDGTIYVSVQSRGIANQWLLSVDQDKVGNSDGKLTKDEIQAFVGKRPIPVEFFERTFDRGDKNKDGELEGSEIDEAFMAPGNHAGASFDNEKAEDEYIAAVRGGGEGDVTETHVVWRHPTKHTDHIVSPLVSDGRMMLIKCGGVSTMFDVENGKPVRGPKRTGSGNYLASPVLGADKIYIAGEDGTVQVVENGPGLKELARNDMGEEVTATPSIADNRLYIRTRHTLYCVSNQKTETASTK